MVRSASVCTILLSVCFSFLVAFALKLWDIKRGESEASAWLRNDMLTMRRSGHVKRGSVAFREGSQKAKDLLPIVLSELNKTFEQASKKAKNEYENGFVAKAMAKVGLFDQAIQVADGIKSHIDRVTVLCYVGKAAVEAKQFDKAIQVANKVTEILKKKPIPFLQLSDLSPVWAIRNFVKAMAEAGFFEQAVQLARFSDHVFSSVFVFHDVARAAVKAGYHKQFFKIVQKEKDTKIRSLLLKSFALELADAGHFDRAIQTANSIEDSYSRVEALCGIAKKIAKAGQKERSADIFDRAIKVAAKSNRKRSMLTLVIVEGMAEAGFFDQALEIVKGVEKSYSRSELLYATAKGMANAGHFDRAFEIAKSIEHPCLRSDAFYALAEMAMGVEKEKAIDALRQAIQSAKLITDTPPKRSTLVSKIAQLMAKAKMKDQAIWNALIQCAKGIERCKSDRSWALCEIARAMAEIGLFDQAIQVYEIVDDLPLLRDIAQKMVKAGLLERALNIAYGIKDVSRRSWMLWQIAEAAAEEGKFEQAIQIASSIVHAPERLRAFRDIVRQMVRTRHFDLNQLDQAVQVAQKIEDASWRSVAIRWIAERAAIAGFFDRAIKVAEIIKDVSNRSLAFYCIAEAMAKAGLFEQAFETAKRADDPIRRLQALAAIILEIRKEMDRAG